MTAAPSFSAADAVDSWTNRIGRALQATPQALHNGTVTFAQGKSGRTVGYPLSAFLPSEQERLRCRLKDTALPDGLKAAHDFSSRIIKRSSLLKESGSLSEQEFKKAVAQAAAAFRAQAAPLVAQKQLSQERLELIVGELVAAEVH